MDPRPRTLDRIQSSGRLDIRSLKLWASTLPASNILREMLLMEPDELNVYEYLAKLPIWLKLEKHETRL